MHEEWAQSSKLTALVRIGWEWLYLAYHKYNSILGYVLHDFIYKTIFFEWFHVGNSQIFVLVNWKVDLQVN